MQYLTSFLLLLLFAASAVVRAFSAAPDGAAEPGAAERAAAAPVEPANRAHMDWLDIPEAMAALAKTA